MEIRTDLALERATRIGPCSGIRSVTRGQAFRITEITIDSDEAGMPIGRGRGRYVTLESAHLHHSTPQLRAQTEELADELRRFLPEKGAVLAVGLGNADITPDALGPSAAGRILATRHLRRELADHAPETDFLRSLRPVSVLANGVLGQTGIETAELIGAVQHTVHAACAVAVDALACSDVSRLGTTVQISDAGISPGSGVENRRAELSMRTLGLPVIAIGVPTVVDLQTIIGQAGGHMPKELPNMMVTPRNIDELIHHAARLIADALNLALHPQLDYEDAAGL